MKKVVHNLPDPVYVKLTVQLEAKKIPILNIINKEKCLESYIQLDGNKDKHVISDEKYAYKIYPFKYLITDDKHQMEFANEYNIFSSLNMMTIKNIIQLDAVLLGQ